MNPTDDIELAELLPEPSEQEELDALADSWEVSELVEE